MKETLLSADIGRTVARSIDCTWNTDCTDTISHYKYTDYMKRTSSLEFINFMKTT